MRTMQQWFDEYAVSHQNHTNKSIHYVCVPLIFFSIVGLLLSIPFPGINSGFAYEPWVLNWATTALVLVFIFYLRISVAVAFQMLLFSVVCIVLNLLIAQVATLWIISLIIFTAAWIGQFYGHKIEGKKPSFLKDMQFLLIGPAWVMHHWLGKK